MTSATAPSELPFTEDDELSDVPQPGTTVLGYDAHENVAALIHQIGDMTTAPGMPFDLRIENEGEHFGIYISTLAPADAEGGRPYVIVFSCQLRREDMAALVSAPTAE